MSNMVVKQVIPILCDTSKWCVLPYPGNPYGCPNYAKADKCPPNAPRFDEYYDISQPVYALIGEYDLGAHVQKMKLAHPDWSERQLRCVLYWQKTARKMLWSEANIWLLEHPKYEGTQCPEGMGINVVQTLLMAGVKLVFPPKDIVNLVIMAAIPMELCGQLEIF